MYSDRKERGGILLPFISLIILGERFCGRRFYLEVARKMAEVRPFKENVEEQCLRDGSLPSKSLQRGEGDDFVGEEQRS